MVNECPNQARVKASRIPKVYCFIYSLSHFSLSSLSDLWRMLFCEFWEVNQSAITWAFFDAPALVAVCTSLVSSSQQPSSAPAKHVTSASISSWASCPLREDAQGQQLLHSVSQKVARETRSKILWITNAPVPLKFLVFRNILTLLFFLICYVIHFSLLRLVSQEYFRVKQMSSGLSVSNSFI